MSARIPTPVNEPVQGYAPGSPERASLKRTLAELSSERIEIPLIIGGEDVRTGETGCVTMPHRHHHPLAAWHKAGAAEVERAVRVALDAREEWASRTLQERAAIFLRAADLLATTWRDTLNAATMLNQSKSPHQAEIDAACETIDFFRFNCRFAQQIHDEQPLSVPGTWNRMDYRPLEGFVYAVTPFNFTSIAGNLPTAPAILGNTVVWKCASSTVFSNYFVMRLLEAAGLPPGVINFVPGDARLVSDVVLGHVDLAGIHFTGSTDVFQGMWRTVGENISRYRSYPRLVGETGGKDFILAHKSADADELVTAIVRGGYEFQGQKCSAASRVYIPETMWGRIRDRLVDEIRAIRMGDVADFRNFMGAVIDRAAFTRLSGCLEQARRSSAAEIMAGGGARSDEGWFIEPTLIKADAPDYPTMTTELFGPIVTAFVYPDGDWKRCLELVDTTSPYALTGAVFARDRRAIVEAEGALRNAAGNFYINDKPTGAVVGQQPFGGARASGTNDKAGSMLNLLRWVSARAIKETFVPPTCYEYPFMQSD